MAMRRHVSVLQHHVEKAVRIILRPGVEIVIHAPPRRLTGFFERSLDQVTIDQHRGFNA